MDELCPDCGLPRISAADQDPGRSTPRCLCRETTQRGPGFDGQQPTRVQQAPAGEARIVPARRGGYRPVGVIGKGGMGQVALVHDEQLERDVVMKELLPRSSQDPTALQRFLVEAQVTGQLEHPNIVPVHELGWSADGAPYFTMKHVSGRTLSELIRLQRSDHGAAARLQHFRAICHAIAFAHDRGVIHRDLKPDNIMVGEFGEVLVMDWGLAKRLGAADAASGRAQALDDSAHGLTLDGAIMGTPRYMAPEQARGESERIGPAADIYALGAILYELLTGRPAFAAAGTLQMTLLQVSEGGYTPPGEGADHAPVPPELAAIVAKAMALEPEDRYPSALALLADVDAFLAGYSVSVHRDSPLRRALKWARRNRAVAIGLLATLLSLCALIAAQRLRSDQLLRGELLAIEQRLAGADAGDDEALHAAIDQLDQLAGEHPGRRRIPALRAHAIDALGRRLEARWRDAARLAPPGRAASPAQRRGWFERQSEVLRAGRKLQEQGADAPALRAVVAGVSHAIARQLIRDGSVGMAQVMLGEAARNGLDPRKLRVARARIEEAPARRQRLADDTLRASGGALDFPRPERHRALIDLLQLDGGEVVRALIERLASPSDAGHRLACQALAELADDSTRAEIPARQLPSLAEPPARSHPPQRLARRLYRAARAPHEGDPLSLTASELIELRLLRELCEPAPQLQPGSQGAGLRAVRQLREARLLVALAPRRAAPLLAALAWHHRPFSGPWREACQLARRLRLPPGALAPGAPPLHQAMIALVAGKPARALTLAEQALAAGGDRSFAHAVAALACDEGAPQPVDALAHIERAIAVDKQRAEWPLAKGAMLARDPARGDEARSALEHAARLAPYWDTPRWQLLRLLRRRGQLEPAAELAASLPLPGELELAAELALLALARQRPRESAALLDPLRELGRDSASYQLARARTLAALDQPRAAYQACEAAAHLRPGDREPLLLAAELCQRLGVVEVANLKRRLQTLALTDSDDHELRYALAQLELRQGEVDTAALQAGYSSKFYADRALGRIREARAIEDAPRYRLLHAQLLAGQARFDEVLSALASATGAAELRLRSRAWRGKGELQRAADDLQSAIQADPQDPHALAELGVLLLRAGDPAEGRRLLERAFELGAEDSEALAGLAQALVAAGQSERALAVLDRAIQGQPHPALKLPMLRQRLQLLLAARRQHAALACANRILQIEYRADQTRLQRLQVHLELDHVELAIYDLRILLRHQPPSWSAAPTLRAKLAELERRLTNQD